MKWATASNWQRIIVLPSDSRTTLNPSATISKRKNESALRPASKIAAVTHQPCNRAVNRRALTDDEEHCGGCSSAVGVEEAIVGCAGAVSSWSATHTTSNPTPIGHHFDYEEPKKTR